MRVFASAVMPATQQATWSSILYIFSDCLRWSSSFDVMRFSAAITMPSPFARIATADAWVVSCRGSFVFVLCLFCICFEKGEEA
jgi:hypothetical protein